MSKDFHRKAFDEGSLLKLNLFKDYLITWLPVFFDSKIVKLRKVGIFDFFAGPGRDLDGNEGTPLIIIEEVRRYSNSIYEKDIKTNLYFNEKIKKKFKSLKAELDRFQNLPFDITVQNLEFDISYTSTKKFFRDSANLLFFDQAGLKHITEKVFLELINFKTTDFMFFISSSSFHRFKKTEVFDKYIKIDKNAFSRYEDVHRNVAEAYKSLIPNDKTFYISPFSIKKGSNIYGVIFGSNHYLGIEKFLRIAWKYDSLRGEANFDIDNDKINLDTPSLFNKYNKANKLNVFQDELERKILGKILPTDRSIYLFSLENGFLPDHAREVIKKLKKENKIRRETFRISNGSMEKNYEPKIINVI